jgi:2-oxo-hept-3-ene-1,7-dioate hydratase
MLNAKTIQELAERLNKAEKARRQIRHFSLEFPEMTIEDAYAIQRAWMALKISEGRTMIGHKIGLTSRAMQQLSKIDEPDYGVLLDDMLFNDGATIPSERFMTIRLELELAFILNKPLTGPNCSIFDVLNATDFVTPAAEILDVRIQRVDPETKATRKIVDTISDNAANAGIIMGGRPFRPLDLDMRWVSALCYRNGRIEETGVAAGVLNHPANGVAWLANKLHPHGVSLKPGQIVLSGSFIRAIDAVKGDVFQGDYGPLGSITCQFG